MVHFFSKKMKLIDRPYFGCPREVLVKSSTLLQNLEQFIESNADHSWQDFLNNMSCQGTQADAIIIQALANCLNLSIHIAESFQMFAPVTVVQAVNVTGEYTNIYIGHISKTHYVSTVEMRNCQVPNNKTCDQTVFERKKKTGKIQS